MTNKLFRTLKITCLCMALTAALPIVSFADEQTAVNENKKVVTIIHLDENGNPLEEDKQTESSEENTDTASEEKNTDDTAADSAEAEEADEENADDEEVLEAEVDVEDDLRSEIVTYALQFVGNRYKYGGTNPNTGVDCSGFTSYVMRHAAGVELPHSSGGQSRMGRVVSSSEMRRYYQLRFRKENQPCCSLYRKWTDRTCLHREDRNQGFQMELPYTGPDRKRTWRLT